MALAIRRASASGRLGRNYFEELRIEHVDAVPGQLECVMTFLWAWPRTAVQAVLLLRRGGEGTPAECVCARWRAAAARARPPSAPALDRSPDGRRCFSAPPGEPCGWFWLEALVVVERLGERALDDWSTEVQHAARNGSWVPTRWAEETELRVRMEFWALRDLDTLHRARDRTWWGLEVGTASEFVEDRLGSTSCFGDVWRPCQVTLFLDRLYMATHRVEAVELQLDMSRYHWILLRGREPEERVFVRDWQLRYYGNGAALPVSQ